MIRLENARDLVDPVLVAAFEGWNDAAEAASEAVEHLEEVTAARPLGELEPDDYYDFQVARPVVSMDGGGIRSIQWPTTRLSTGRLPGARRDLIILRGVEPSMRWRPFCTEILTAARDLRVRTIVTLAALAANVPHTRPVPVSGSTADERLASRLKLPPPVYEGPTGIVGVLQDASYRAGFPAVSFWAAVPHYVSQTHCPKATIALLRKVEDFLDVAVPLGDLPEDARAWETGVDELAADDAEIAEYVRELESEQDAAELPEASGEHIAQEFERYLRRREQGDR